MRTARLVDEHYYVACAKRLAWGYVDHPPLGPFILRVAMTLAGDSLAVLRAVASTFGALTVFGTGLLAARLGAGRLGQGLASAAMLASPIGQVIFAVGGNPPQAPATARRSRRQAGPDMRTSEIPRRNEA